MAFDPLKRYYKLNLALLVLGGCAFAWVTWQGQLTGTGLDPVAQVVGPLAAAEHEPGSPEQLKAELLAAKARIVTMQERLYLLAAELRNCIESPPTRGGSARRVIPARVLQSYDLSHLRHTLRIDRGRADGLEEGLPVTCLGWLIGKLARVDEHASSVVLLQDTTFRTEVRLGAPAGEAAVPTGFEAGRPTGIFVGLGGLGGLGEVIHVPATGRNVPTRVEAGSVVYTAGSGNMPAGLPLGVVSEIKGNREGLFLDVRVKPAMDLEWIELVQVEIGLAELRADASGGGW